MRALRIILLALAFISLQAHADDDRNLAVNQVNNAVSEQRIALVIGNSKYKDAPLVNPINDARDMAKVLSGLGFKVLLRENATQSEMKQAIREFASVIREGSIGLFYFAGHGIQAKGHNYLVPVGANILQEFELEDQAVDANLILGAMDEAKNRVNIVILDACRNNPFARSFRSAQSGLAQMDSARGTLISYATAPGSVAADGTGRNGIYTKHLLASLQQGDSDISKVFTRVRAAVVNETGGRQTPWESTSLIGDFYFNPAHAAPTKDQANAATSVPPSLLAIEIAFWESVQASRNNADFEAYLKRYPSGQFAEVARNHIVALAAPTVSTGAAVASAPMANVVFFRQKAFMGWVNDFIILVRGRELGQLTNGSYFRVQMPAGEQIVTAEGAVIQQRMFDFEPGKTYYIRLEHLAGAIALRVVQEVEALEALKELRPSDKPTRE